jgi:hypothetical protein
MQEVPANSCSEGQADCSEGTQSDAQPGSGAGMKSIEAVGRVYKGCVILETAERVVVVTPAEHVLGPFASADAAEKFIDEGQAVIVKAELIGEVTA